MSTRGFFEQVREEFDAVSEALFSALQAGEDLTLNLAAEDTLFIRFNGNRVRQNTDVTQRVLSLIFHVRGRSVEQSLTLSGRQDSDRQAAAEALLRCRAEAAFLPLDPHQVALLNNGSSEEEFRGSLLPPAELIRMILDPAAGSDMVGLYAGGVLIRANRNSKGQKHWFATENFFFDYSLYKGPKAVKGVYSASVWNSEDWAASLRRSRELLALLARPVQEVKPGAYRSYLAPPAFADLVGMLGWDALSAAACKQGRSPLKKLVEKDLRLSPLFSLEENFSLGLSPRFNAQGEVAAARLPLIQEGEIAHLLVSSRSAKEYGLQANGAAEGESPRAMDVSTGSLAQADVLANLGTGLYLSNLHYLNWSDPMSARVTGMTRYACFWVQGGEIVGPIQNLRWDESLFSALGSKLMALTQEAEIAPAVGTYFERSLGGSRTPGALIDAFNFTL
jgi:predicted Zn-dependent protease